MLPKDLSQRKNFKKSIFTLAYTKTDSSDRRIQYVVITYFSPNRRAFKPGETISQAV